MNLFSLLVALFLLMPLAEIWVLLQVGHAIGAGWTILLVLASAVIGAGLVRAQGLAVLSRVRAELDRGSIPALEMMRGLLLFIAGALLLTPGFITDTFGLLLLLPPVQSLVIKAILRRAVVSAQVVSAAGARQGEKPAIDGSFHREP